MMEVKNIVFLKIVFGCMVKGGLYLLQNKECCAFDCTFCTNCNLYNAYESY